MTSSTEPIPGHHARQPSAYRESSIIAGVVLARHALAIPAEANHASRPSIGIS